jgi:methionyl-tRNA formyltransferase
MKHRKYLFVGNRRPVLDEMIKLNLPITKVLVMEIGYLAKTIDELNLNYSIIRSKKDLLKELELIDYDILISNGCQYILPISKLKKADYINIHPSYLPDLKGRDPCNGSIFLKRDSGATCHIMDDKIDNGDIIHQINIPYNDKLYAAYLYRLCFIAEVMCFREAFKNNFKPSFKQVPRLDDIYYSIQLSDRIINFNSIDLLLSQIKAFNTPSKGCFFKSNKNIYRVFEADIVQDRILCEFYKNEDDCKILLIYDDKIIFKLNKQFVRFSKIDGNINQLLENNYISKCYPNDLEDYLIN